MSAADTIRQTIAALRVEADNLERVLGADPDGVAAFDSNGDLLIFDPDVDQPPVRPYIKGSEEQQNWCGLMLWAQLRSLNVRQGRGASPEESVGIAQTAGYQDGRGWNRWEFGWFKDENGDRWADEDWGLRHLRNFYAAVRRAVPDDLN